MGFGESFFEESWNVKSSSSETVWDYAILNIKSNGFWEKMSMFDDKFFREWNVINETNECSWDYALHSIRSDIFWKNIASKDKSIFAYWYKQKYTHQGNKSTIWAELAEKSKIEVLSKGHMIFRNFWITISNREDEFFKEWNIMDRNKLTIWHYVSAFLKYNEFWDNISKKDYTIFEDWGIKEGYENIWHVAIENIKSNIFWKNISLKSNIIFESWNIQNGDVYNKMSSWDLAIKKINDKEFWKNISNKIDKNEINIDEKYIKNVKEKINNILSEDGNQTGGNYKKKYMKYLIKSNLKKL